MRKFSFIILSVSSKAVLAQMPSTINWLSAQLQVNINNKWQWLSDASYRTIGMSASAYQYTFRTGAKYEFNKKWSVSTGGAFFFTRSTYEKSNHEFGRESRLWHELQAQHPLSKTVSLQNRFRIEERWFEATTKKEAYFGLRLRHRLIIAKYINKKWTLQAGDEYMRQLSERKFSLNQNRVLARALYSINPSTQLQGGYIWVKWPSESQHYFTFTFQKIISLHGVKANS